MDEFRRSDEAHDFADNWLKAQRAGDCASDYHMNLLAWTSNNPFHVLAIILDLIDRVDKDDPCAEMIALGPIEWLFEHASDDFVPVINEAIRKHPKLATWTKWKRENSSKKTWKRFGTIKQPNKQNKTVHRTIHRAAVSGESKLD